MSYLLGRGPVSDEVRERIGVPEEPSIVATPVENLYPGMWVQVDTMVPRHAEWAPQPQWREVVSVEHLDNPVGSMHDYVLLQLRGIQAIMMQAGSMMWSSTERPERLAGD